MSAESAAVQATGNRSPHWLRSRQFLGPVVAIGGIQLMATMDGPIAVFALPKIQSELGLSDAAVTWVVTAYMLTFGGLILLGGRLGDAFGRKRTFISGVALFTVASVMCGLAWDGGSLVAARLLHGVAAAIVTPTCMALVATTFPKGPTRNAAAAVFGAMATVGVVLGLVAGGALTGVSWRLAFLVNVPIGLLVIWLARTMLHETHKERMKLDAAGAVLATAACIAVVFGLSTAPQNGWLSISTMASGVFALTAFVAFIAVERTAQHPVLPFDVFQDRDRLAVFSSMFLVRGVGFTLTVLIAVYVQNVMGYSPLRAGISFIPFAIAMTLGVVVASRLVTCFSPRLVVIGGSALTAAAVVYGGATLSPDAQYFPNLVVPITVGAVGLGAISVPLGLALIASVGVDRIGPTSAVAVMLQNLAGPMVLVVIQTVITSRTMQLAGPTGPIEAMTEDQLRALDRGYAHGLMWLAAVLVLLIGAALFIRYSAQEVAHAQKAREGREF